MSTARVLSLVEFEVETHLHQPPSEWVKITWQANSAAEMKFTLQSDPLSPSSRFYKLFSQALLLKAAQESR